MRRREEKKNTMLLTVIAVATLLVAVVGATFAYFSLSITNNSNATSATVTAGKVGTVELTGGTTGLQLKVNATDMTKELGGNKYYAIKSPADLEGPENDGEATGGIYSKEVATFDIATATLSEADASATYTCGYKVTVAAEAGTQDMSTVFKEGDVFFSITGDGVKNATEVDLKSVDAAGYKGTFTLKAGQTTSTVKASLWLVNKASSVQDGGADAGDQNYLAGKDMTVKFTVAADPDVPCTITTTPVQE